jgi:alpha-tubulin suppressor-like RCC1 family protein
MMVMGARWPRFGFVLSAVMVAGCSADLASGVGGASTIGGGGGSVGGADAGTFEAPLVATAIAAGASHTCAIVDGGRVMCWGDGTRGQLGDGVSPKEHRSLVPQPVPGLVGATAIRAGGDTTCAIVGGGVLCWGAGDFGQLGNGVAKDGYVSVKPVPVTGLSGVIDLSVTGTNACAALEDGSVWCWGRNAPEAWLGFTSPDCGPYTLENPDGPSKSVSYPCEAAPKVVPSAKLAKRVASGGAHNCLRTDEGSLRCWGSDQFGQLGVGTFGAGAYEADPVEVKGVMNVGGLALGASHTCVVEEPSGHVLCWGDNAYGQLGIGTDALDSYKVEPALVPSLDGVVDIASSAHATCAARADGTVACWGDTTHLLPGGIALLPTVLPGLEGVTTVAAGGAHACALRTDGAVACWGNSDKGQLGTGRVGLDDFSFHAVTAPPEAPN